MKFLVILVAGFLSAGVRAQGAVSEFGVEDTATILDYVSGLTGAAGPMIDGIYFASIEVECSSTDLEANLGSMNCFARSAKGFSILSAPPTLVPANVGAILKPILLDKNMSYQINSGYPAYGGQLSCSADTSNPDNVGCFLKAIN